jgi:hypothetical protein
MKVVCSWCRGEGQDGLVGEKAPFDDPRETHSICLTHETAVRARWEARRHMTRVLSIPARLIRSLVCCTSWLVLFTLQLGAGSFQGWFQWVASSSS